MMVTCRECVLHSWSSVMNVTMMVKCRECVLHSWSSVVSVITLMVQCFERYNDGQVS